MAPRPRRWSGPLLGFLVLCVTVFAAAWAIVPWLPQMAPIAFNKPAPILVPIAATTSAALTVAYLLVALFFGLQSRGRTLRLSLWYAAASAMCTLIPIALLLAVRGGAPELGAKLHGALLITVLPTLGVILMVRLSERAAAVAAQIFIAIAAAVLVSFSFPLLSKASLGHWGGLGLGLLVFGFAIGRLLSSRDAASKSKWGAIVGLGAVIMSVTMLVLGMELLIEAAEPVLRSGGYLFGDAPLSKVILSLRNLGIVIGTRAPILLGSIGLALLLIRYYFSFFTTVSIGGVMVGSMALILVLSVMSGFENDLRTKILASNAHILVSKPDGKFVEYDEVMKELESVPGLVAQSPYLISEVVIAARSNYSNVIIKGVDPKSFGEVTKIEENLEQKRPRALDYMYPLADDGGVLGPPPDAAPDEQTVRDAGGTDAMDPGPDDFNVPDFDPLDFSGGSVIDAGVASADEDGDQADEDEDTPTALDPSEIDPEDVDPPPEDFGLGDDDDDEVLDMSGDGEPETEPMVDGIDTMDTPEGGTVLMRDGKAVTVDDLEELPVGSEYGLGEGLYETSPEVAVLPGVLVGLELVKGLSLYVGQEVTVVSPLSEDSPLGPVPRTKKYRIAGTFYTGMYEYDLKYVYVELSTLQDFLDLGDEVNGIEIRIKDPDATVTAMDAIRAKLGSKYRVQDWRALNKSLFSALKLEKIAMFIVLTIVILVASFSIVGNLIMVVIEKAREIAVLKTLGATNQAVTQIFIGQGFAIGAIGTAIGVGLGLFHSLWTLAGIPLDKEVYYIDRMPVHVEPTAVLLVALAAMIISVAATIYPARLAASQEPVDGLSRE